MEPFGQHFNCCIDHTMHKVSVNFRISHRLSPNLSASFTHKERVFFVKIFKQLHSLFFIHMQTDHDGGTDAKHTVQLGK